MKRRVFLILCGLAADPVLIPQAHRPLHPGHLHALLANRSFFRAISTPARSFTPSTTAATTRCISAIPMRNLPCRPERSSSTAMASISTATRSASIFSRNISTGIGRRANPTFRWAIRSMVRAAVLHGLGFELRESPMAQPLKPSEKINLPPPQLSYHP